MNWEERGEGLFNLYVMKGGCLRWFVRHKESGQIKNSLVRERYRGELSVPERIKRNVIKRFLHMGLIGKLCGKC